VFGRLLELKKVHLILDALKLSGVLLPENKDQLGGKLENGGAIVIGQNSRSTKLKRLADVLEDVSDSGPNAARVSIVFCP